MSIIHQLKQAVFGFPIIGSAIRDSLQARWFIRHLHTSISDEEISAPPSTSLWEERIATAIASPDNEHIPRVKEAGQVSGSQLTMHNGLRLLANSYYGLDNLKLLVANKGVHEPQEERIFQDLLDNAPSGATMVEAGAYWAFYSLWFKTTVKDSSCYMLEPDKYNLLAGKENFKINAQSGSFTQAFIDAKDAPKSGDSPPTVCMDSFFATKNLTDVYILLADIQGFELRMLEGSGKVLSDKKVQNWVISTHSEELHAQCREALEKFDLFILADISPAESFSFDGLLVASIDQKVTPSPPLSRRVADQPSV